MKTGVINFSDIAKSPNMSLSPKDYIKEEVEVKEQLTVFKNTRPISDLVTSARLIQEGCKDFVVPSSEIQFGVQNNIIPKILFAKHDLKSGDMENHNLSMSDHAFSQLCSKIGVPVRFMRKCMEDKHPQIVADSVNTYLQEQKNKTMFVRTNNDHIRGILSEKYSVLDAPDILESIEEVLPNAPVKGFYMNDERLHARILGSPLNIPNEDLFWGLQIDSSDVGRSILKVQFLLYKQVCTNGLVVSKGGGSIFTQRHIGITKQEFITEFRDGISNIPNVITMITEDIARSKHEMTSKVITIMVQSAIDSLKLDKTLEEKILDTTSKYGKSKWGVVNALTEISQKYTLEKRLEIEEYAGILLTA